MLTFLSKAKCMKATEVRFLQQSTFQLGQAPSLVLCGQVTENCHGVKSVDPSISLV